MRRLLVVALLALVGAGLIAYGVHIELIIRDSMATGSGAGMRRFWVSLSPGAREQLAWWHLIAGSCLGGGAALLAVSHLFAWRWGRGSRRAR